MNRKYLFIIMLTAFLFQTCKNSSTEKILCIADNLTQIDEFTISGSKHFVRDFQPIDEEGNLNVVVEIPTGTNEKWEVDKKSGNLKLEFRNKNPRIIKYLSYPANYGMIPQTLLPEEEGGDNDPLDVIVLGSAEKRGSVIKVRLIGVLKLIDNGERDDKLIAVKKDSHIFEIDELIELDQNFFGISEIIKIWLTNYKGKGQLISNGYGNSGEAKIILDKAMAAYDREIAH